MCFFFFHFCSLFVYFSIGFIFEKLKKKQTTTLFVSNCELGIVEAYDRRDKPSVLVTSPSSPDRVAGGASSSGARYSNRLTSAGSVVGDSNVGGRIQIKLGFEPGTLQLILTVICAAGLTYRANGATRNPYVKVNQSSS